MDNKNKISTDNPLPNHVQVDNNQKPAKEEKKFIIFYSDAQTPEGSDGRYVIVQGMDQAFLKCAELKIQGATKIAIYQQVHLKISMS